jgi:uncharacterized protein YceH (UPF0502 family)
MVEFDSIGALLHELEVLADQPDPLVRLQMRRPGQKEDRWQQLLADELGATSLPGGADDPTDGGPTVGATDGSREPEEQGSAFGRSDDFDQGTGLGDRVDVLEAELKELRSQVGSLSHALDRLRRNLGEDDFGG